jgi:hypothetical protein
VSLLGNTTILRSTVRSIFPLEKDDDIDSMDVILIKDFVNG